MTHTTLEITEDVTDVTATGDQITINITDDVTTVEAFTLAVPTTITNTLPAENVTFSAYNTITADNVRDALQQLADQNFRSASAPSGANVGEGDIWYDTDDDQLKVYRETSTGNFAFVPIMVGNVSSDSDTIDAGSY